MSFYNLYKPYSEAPTVRTTVQPVSGGINIDKSTAQGISLRNAMTRQTSLLPQINAGRSDFVVECLNFGTSEPVDETEPFEDRKRWTAQAYLEDPDQFGYPLYLGSYLPKDGALEPLIIRDAATGDSIEDPFSHRIRGHIMCGNEDSFDGADIKSSFISYNKNSDFVPFQDFSDSLGNIVMPGYVAYAPSDKISPFDESDANINERFQINNDEIVERWNALEISPFFGKEEFSVFEPNFETLIDPISGIAGTNNGSQYVSEFDARYFDGTSSNRITFDPPANVSGSNLSITCWIKPESLETSQALFSISGSSDSVGAIAVSVNDDRTIGFYSGFDVTALFKKTILKIQEDEWTHLAFTYDGSGNHSGVRIYVDGFEQDCTSEVDGTGSNGTYGEWYIGNNQSLILSMTGSISKLSVRTDILSRTQIEYLAARKPGRPDLTIVRDSKFFDDDFRPKNTKSATCGFVYSNKEGTDSIAFGGLLKG